MIERFTLDGAHVRLEPLTMAHADELLAASNEDRIVGSTSFFPEWWGERGDRPPDVVEIGATFLAASAQRTPVNTEAKLLMFTHAFEVWGVQRVSLKTDARNERSRAAIERLGARYDGTLRRHMPAYGPGGGPRDSAFFSILNEEWPDVKSRLQTRLRPY